MLAGERARRALERATASANGGPVVQVTLAHVAAVVAEVFGSPYVQKVRQLPFHGKLALCTLVLLQQARRVRDIALGDIQRVYAALCKHRGLVGTVSRSEFFDLCSALESGACVCVWGGGGSGAPPDARPSTPLTWPPRTLRCKLCLPTVRAAGGLVTMAKAREEALRKVTLGVQADDVRFALRDDDLVLRMLGDGLPAAVLKSCGL